jgi:hypothetical protein
LDEFVQVEVSRACVMKASRYLIKKCAAVHTLFLTGYITRCFPTEEAKVQVQAVLHFLGAILLEQNGK